jgi:hypothetical protein
VRLAWLVARGSWPPIGPWSEYFFQMVAHFIWSDDRPFYVLRLHPVLRRLCVAVFFRWPFEGLHCVHLSASTLYGYIEHEMSRVNGATDTLSMGPSTGCFLFFVFVHVLLMFAVYASSYTYMHIYVITYITLFFWIKLKLKMPKFLTIDITRTYNMFINCYVNNMYIVLFCWNVIARLAHELAS